MRTTATIDQILREFLTEQDTRQNSKATYERYLKMFFRHIHSLNFDKRSLERKHLLLWKEYVQGKYSQNTISNIIIVVKMFYSWLETKGYYDDITKKIKTPPKYKGFAKMPLQQCEAILLLNSVGNETPKQKRDFAILRLLLNRGLRLIEVNRANIEDIFQIGNDTALRIQRKGHNEKDDFIIITGTVHQAIQNYLSTRLDTADTDSIFVSYSNQNPGQRLSTDAINRMVNLYLKKTNLKQKRISAHSLRHTAASILIQQDCGIYDVQKLLGHSKTEITELYTQYAADYLKIENKAGKHLDKLF